MRIIEISTLDNGAHRNQTFNGVIPEGWAAIHNNMKTENFPFGEIEVQEINGIMTVTKWTPSELPVPDLTENKSEKETEISTACNNAIITGMDVETTQGTEHFSLEETDQINLTTAYNAIMQGADFYPYHSDGGLCRMFTADEIKAIFNASIQHKLYHTTLCNHLLAWIRRADSIEEINSITYGTDNLPNDLRLNFELLLKEIK